MNELVTHNPWEALVAHAHKYPIGTRDQVRQLLTDLNTRQNQTEMEFHALPVVDGAENPDVQYDIPHVRVTTIGPEVLKILNQLPISVRKRIDLKHQVWQIRLDDWTSFDHQMGETTLLAFFIEALEEESECYLWPNDEYSDRNWQTILSMHNEYFPEGNIDQNEI